MDDGLYWVYKGCRLDKNEFGIIGVQIAGARVINAFLYSFSLIDLQISGMNKFLAY